MSLQNLFQRLRRGCFSCNASLAITLHLKNFTMSRTLHINKLVFNLHYRLSDETIVWAKQGKLMTMIFSLGHSFIIRFQTFHNKVLIQCSGTLISNPVVNSIILLSHRANSQREKVRFFNLSIRKLTED